VTMSQTLPPLECHQGIAKSIFFRIVNPIQIHKEFMVDNPKSKSQSTFQNGFTIQSNSL